uniref:Uncharacterized protein n=1 Tax=Ascaris lumbricoides TaxID=6252 RepID=A0A0M3I563_ASCLU
MYEGDRERPETATRKRRSASKRNSHKRSALWTCVTAKQMRAALELNDAVSSCCYLQKSFNVLPEIRLFADVAVFWLQQVRVLIQLGCDLLNFRIMPKKFERSHLMRNLLPLKVSLTCS